MSANCAARLRLLIPVCLIVLGLPSEFRAQNRVIGRVEPNKGFISNTAELYDPGTKTFSPAAGTMITSRVGQTETRLLGGKVLITGGMSDIDYLDSAEIYDPSTRNFTQTTKIDETTSEPVESLMNAARTGHTATLLNNGMVLITGGYNGSYLTTAELYSPTAGIFTQLSNGLVEARAYHTATLMPDGQVLITGGYNGSYLKTIEIFNPQTLKFVEIGATTNDARAHHIATLLNTGEILIAGGYSGEAYLASAVIYTPSSLATRTLSAKLTVARSSPAINLLLDGKVLIAGGTNGNPLASAETFDPANSTFSATANQMTAAREGLTATLLPDGKVVVAGGTNGSPLATADIFDPSSRSFSVNPGLMISPRQNHSATSLEDGKVLLAGGQTGKLLQFDVNADSTDNVAPNIVFSSDSARGFASFAGSGAVIAFSVQTGAVLNVIQTGGQPDIITPLSDGHTIAAVSALDNKIFLIDTNSMQLVSTLTFPLAAFGFGSILTVSHSGNVGYISSTGTGEVIKFSLPGGSEQGRLTGLQAPAQITLSADDATLMVVDANSEQLIFADASTMKQKSVLDTKGKDALANFSIATKAVLSADGAAGIIASLGPNSDSRYTVFIFKVSTGEIVTTESLSYAPGHTALTPNGQHWVILTPASILYVPTADPDSCKELSAVEGALASSYMIFSPDSQYIYYPSASSDSFVQQNLATVAVVGQLNVGDDPNKRLDQTSTVAVTPDGKTFAALNFITNNIALIGSKSVLNTTKFESGNNIFTGLSLVNVSATPANVKITATTDFGTTISGTGIVNPVALRLPANGQISVTVDQLFNFDPNADTQTGWLSIESDQAGLVGYTSLGRVKWNFLSTYIDKCNGVPLFGPSLYDWIVPEVSRESGVATEFNFLNRDFSTADYDISRMVEDGSLIQKTTGNTVAVGTRKSQSFTSTYTQPQAGMVLIAGGENSTGTLSSAEYYSPEGLIFTATGGSLSQATKSQMAAVMSNGTVLLAGGRDGSNVILSNAQIYDPANVTFTLTTGAMNTARYRGTATLLQDGRVLIAGGQTSVSTSNTVETYNPITGTFTLEAGKMSSPRSDHTATLLNNGKVLIVGGSDGNVVLNTAELYDPQTGTFTPTGSMSKSRAFHTATLLDNGQVLIAGGYNGSYLNTGEIYDPRTGTFFAANTNMVHSRAYHTATALADGRVLIVGGADATGVLTSVELFDPSIAYFMPSLGGLGTGRKTHGAALLANRKVLVFGGSDGTTSLSSAELYDQLTDSFTAATNGMNAARNNFAYVLLQGAIDGYARVQSQQGLTFTEFYGSADTLGALNGIDMSKYSGVTRVFSPQFETGSGFKTILNVINGNSQVASITIGLHNSDGSPITAPVSFTLQPGGQLKDDLVAIFRYDPAVRQAGGWLEVNSTVDQVVGTISFTNTSDTFLAGFELQGVPLSDFIFPLVSQNESYMTGLALLNPDNSAATVRVELWTPDGTLSGSRTLTLAGGTRTSQYLNQIIQGLGSVASANVRIHSDKPIFGFATLNDPAVHFLSAIPPVPFPNK
jgi:deoxycytidylate deaminase